MAENDQSQEKSEAPSQRRLDKAREDGDVLSSREMFVFATSLCGLLLLVSLGFFAGKIIDTWSSFFEFSHQEELQNLRYTKIWDSLATIFIVGGIFGIPTFLFIIVTQSVVGGMIQFNAKNVSFKFDKLDLFKGLGRIFSIKGLVELVKSIAKVVFLTGAVAATIWLFLPKLIYLSTMNLQDAIRLSYSLLILLILILVILLGVIGLGDYAWSRYSWLQKLRMSRQDLKDEFKETEGSPEVKSRMRRMQMEASQRATRQNEALKDVKNATAVITNPTHFAIALRYDPATDTVPIILAMGKGHIAKRIIDEANNHEKTIVRSPLLARALYFTGDIGLAVEEKLYSAVAAILAYVYQLERGVDAELQNFDIPDDLQFDESGRVLGGNNATT